ncbi:unnamed protein product [Brassica napus]|uniref:(rape) hypothetical protein n=2 Tax=Brassica napus TaxID=3708 RepID=A0A816QZX7_BRANA|nr:unnamed protein product [Brassica napus]
MLRESKTSACSVLEAPPLHLLVIMVSKYEEISVPAVNDLILVSDKVYTGREVLDMEKLMAKYFAIQFLFANSIRVHEEIELLSFFIIKLSLVEYEI